MAGFVGSLWTCAGDSDERADAAAGEWLMRTGWPVRPLRIGLAEAGAWSDPLLATPTASDVEWYALPRDTGTDALLRFRLDAVVSRDEEGELSVTTCENPQREAAWFDWGTDRPLSYPSVFPARIDCANISLGRVNTSELPLAQRMIEAAAVLSRVPARLTLADRVAGRLPTQGERRRASGVHPTKLLPGEQACDAIMNVLAEEAASRATSVRLKVSMVERAAARACGAWLACSPTLIDEAARQEWMEACARICGDEPETMLRLAAVRLASGDDEAGIDAILRADRMLRDRELLPAIDHTAFLSAELELPLATSMTVGRLAAGACVIAATLPSAHAEHVLNDLLDDARFAELLIGRDQDRTLLMRVCHELRRARRVECFSLPAAAVVDNKKRRRRKAA